MTRQRLLRYASDSFGTVPERLWLRYPDYEVLRCAENGKWYGIVMDVPKYKLGKNGEEPADILVIKGDPEEIPLLTEERGFAPAYHMNKKHWLTVILAEAEEETILRMLEKSYSLVMPKRKERS